MAFQPPPPTPDIPELLNFRDLGGTPTHAGPTVRPGRLWRSENLTALGRPQVQRLVNAGLSDVIDLRTHFELAGSPSPLRAVTGVSYHHHSYFREVEDGDAEVLGRALPWADAVIRTRTGHPIADSYLGFLADRPDSALGALRVIARAPGATLVHCAVGRDRTGLTVALALSLVGVPEEVIAVDYARSSERMADVVRRLWTDPTYATDALAEPTPEHLGAHPETILTVLGHLAEAFGGTFAFARSIGWTSEDQDSLKGHLLD